jgi:hypothetical protein
MKKGDGELFLFWLLPALGLTWVLVFLIFPGFSPPMSPTMSAEEVAAFYRDPSNLPLIRWSMIVFNWFSIGMIPFLTLIVVQIGRMGHRTPVMSYAYLGCLTGGPTLLFCADLFWLLAAFRPERDPALTQLFNDIAWVTFTGQVGFPIAECIFLALSIYLDRQPRPVFRTWVAHFNLAIALALAPAAFVGVALTGPLAWDGVLSFWVRNGAMAVWLTVMTIVLGGTLYRQRREEGFADVGFAR